MELPRDGISKDRLVNDINLKIDDFALDKKLDGTIWRYHGLLSDFMARMGQGGAIHIKGSYRPFKPR